MLQDVMQICRVKKLFSGLGAEPRYWHDSYEYGRTLRVNGAREKYVLIERSVMDDDLRVYISTWTSWNDMIYWLQQKLQQTVTSYNQVEISTDQSLWFGLMSIWPYVKFHLKPLPHE